MALHLRSIQMASWINVFRVALKADVPPIDAYLMASSNVGRLRYDRFTWIIATGRYATLFSWK